MRGGRGDRDTICPGCLFGEPGNEAGSIDHLSLSLRQRLAILQTEDDPNCPVVSKRETKRSYSGVLSFLLASIRSFHRRRTAPLCKAVVLATYSGCAWYASSIAVLKSARLQFATRPSVFAVEGSKHTVREPVRVGGRNITCHRKRFLLLNPLAPNEGIRNEEILILELGEIREHLGKHRAPNLLARLPFRHKIVRYCPW